MCASRSLLEMTATNQRPIGNNNHHSESVLVVPPSRNFVPKFYVGFKNWRQIFSAPNCAIPKFAYIPPHFDLLLCGVAFP